jgi:hypothetical protein
MHGDALESALLASTSAATMLAMVPPALTMEGTPSLNLTCRQRVLRRVGGCGKRGEAA